MHFGRAADALLVGQPTVSQQIARLERELGATLFERTSRSVRLSDAGQRFLAPARAVSAAVEQARCAVRGTDRGAPLRIGTSSGQGERLTDVLAALRSATPPVAARLVSAPDQGPAGGGPGRPAGRGLRARHRHGHRP
jgi:DNA-binding transcriptional LysR family regulator